MIKRTVSRDDFHAILTSAAELGGDAGPALVAADIIINPDGEESGSDADDERGSTELQLEITKSDPDKKLIPTEDPNTRRIRKLKEAGYVGL